MSNIAISKKYDLEERTHMFGKKTGKLIEKLPRTILNVEYGKQLVRSSGSVGANYIETNEGLTKKDRIKCMKIARKEAKESEHWLRLIDTKDSAILERGRQFLIQEAQELRRILSAIILKLTK